MRGKARGRGPAGRSRRIAVHSLSFTLFRVGVCVYSIAHAWPLLLVVDSFFSLGTRGRAPNATSPLDAFATEGGGALARPQREQRLSSLPTPPPHCTSHHKWRRQALPTTTKFVLRYETAAGSFANFYSCSPRVKIVCACPACTGGARVCAGACQSRVPALLSTAPLF